MKRGIIASEAVDEEEWIEPVMHNTQDDYIWLLTSRADTKAYKILDSWKNLCYEIRYTLNPRCPGQAARRM